MSNFNNSSFQSNLFDLDESEDFSTSYQTTSTAKQIKRSLLDYSDGYRIALEKKKQVKIVKLINNSSLQSKADRQTPVSNIEEIINRGKAFVNEGLNFKNLPAFNSELSKTTRFYNDSSDEEDDDFEDFDIEYSSELERYCQPHFLEDRINSLEVKVPTFVETLKVDPNLQKPSVSVDFTIGKNDLNHLSKEAIDSHIMNFMLDDKNKSLSIEEALKLINKDENFIQEIFNLSFEKYKEKLKAYNKLGSLEKRIDKINLKRIKENDEIKSFLTYVQEEQDLKIKFSHLKKIKIIYLPSGGGKSTNFSDESVFYDVDALVKKYYASFKLIKDYIKTLGYNNMDAWFRFKIASDWKSIKDKIWVFNSREQIPVHFRYIINEIAIIPKVQFWRCKFFLENLFQLLSYNEIKYFYCDFRDYNFLSSVIFENNFINMFNFDHNFQYNIENNRKDFINVKRKTVKQIGGNFVYK